MANLIDNIVLNIPHSSSDGVLDFGWGEDVLQYVDKWTDWRTDELFIPTNEINAAVVKFNLSRFVVDVERLLDDPMEKIGQGIIYTRFENAVRGEYDAEYLMSLYDEHINQLKSALNEKSLLIDCHSYPSELAENNDICIGFNEDWSKPEPALLECVKKHFEEYGYKTDFNYPYSNSISPKTCFNYRSIMVEVNKSTYNTDEKFSKLQSVIRRLYDKILSDPA